MFSREYRPLRRPKLGIPDFYPQDEKQKEDELTLPTLKYGFRLVPSVEQADEVGSALKDFGQHLLNTKEYIVRVSQVQETKRKTGWVQDSQRRKIQVSKENFLPVPQSRNKKEIATSWFQELAGSKPLSQLAKKVPVFNKKEEIFDYLCEKDVPVFRATWYIKMTAAYNSMMMDSKLNKKKQHADPSFDWTVSLTKYMQECVWRICNESSLYGRPENHSTSRHPSVGAATPTPTEETVVEVRRWQYMVHLSSWLYQENLLDSHEFLRWLVERLEQIKTKDTKSLQLYLPLVIKHLLDIGGCVSLARPLATFCCQRLTMFFELDQKLHKLQPLPPTPVDKPVVVKKEPGTESMEIGEEEDKDSVFTDGTSGHGGATVKQEPGEPKLPNSTPSGRPSSVSSGGRSRAPSSSGATLTANQPNGDGEAPVISANDPKPAQFHWCTHHSSLMVQLFCIIQTIAVKCPTAFVHIRSHRSSAPSKPLVAASPLTLLPVGLAELPMPHSISPELRKKLLPALIMAEQEIQQRNKAAESGWSSMTVADLQTTSEGSNTQKVLSILDVLDAHSFSQCRAHNPLTTLYCRLTRVQNEAEVPLGDDILTLLLCQWAVSPHRAGAHRPLVSARLLRQRQNDVLKGEGWKSDLNQDLLDEMWEESGPTHSGSSNASDYPFQDILVKFLDTRAPLPDDLSSPVCSTDSFFHLLILFSELIRLDVFSYTNYLSTLTARGEIKTPIIPQLPFARDPSDGAILNHPKPEPEQELSLTISLPKKPRLDGPSHGSSALNGTQSSSTGRSLSPSNSSSFMLDALEGIMSGGNSALFHQEDSRGAAGNTEESAALLQERQHKLQSLLAGDSSDSPQLVSPFSFNSPSHDADNAPSPLTQNKSDPFSFSLPFPPTTSLFLEEDQNVNFPINSHASRHLLFATYFPISDSHLSKQELNERAVVLCGVGKMRNKVERIIRKVTVDVEHYFRLLDGITTPVLPDTLIPDLLKRFRALPTFEQRVLATTCEKVLRKALLGTDTNVSHQSCTQLVFVCELLEISGGIQQILNLLVDIIACSVEGKDEDEKEEFESHRHVPPPPLPTVLCLPVISMLQKYLPCLLLSQQDTTVVFEGLCRVLEGLHSSSELNSSRKSTFLFLHRLYSSCTYLQRTYRTVFGPYSVKLKSVPGVLTDSFSPTNSDHGWQRTLLLPLLSKPSECNITQVCSNIKKNNFGLHMFVSDVFSLACQRNFNSQTLCELAHVCAEVSCGCGPMVNRELMGAFRALCLPMSVMKSCQTGFAHLTSKTNILMDPGIHSNLVTFVATLIASGVFFLHDVITYVIKPIIRVQLMHPQGSSQHSSLSLEFVSSLILHLLVDNYIEGNPLPSPPDPDSHPMPTPILLPPFVRHFLQAKCRELDFAYIISLLKDLLRICQPSTSRGTTVGSVKSGMQILVQSVSSVTDGSEAVLSQVRVTLESLSSQDWVKEKCIQQGSKVRDSDKLGDTSLTPSQARYLLNLLTPYTASGSLVSTQIHTTDSNTAVEHILKNLDQWTLRNALLHIDWHISQTQALTLQAQFGLLDHLAGEVIRVFEDSCGDEWLGQTIECCVESGDGAYSPSVWLVTPLISRLKQNNVLGRVLKSAGNVLGQGQWWNPEKSQEKRRATRATSGVAPPKTGLQWQQPFLELVLACMHAQSTTHEELLGPLKTQLSTFLAAYDKEGMPCDEQSKTMLYAALKLRLSLVGSMLASISSAEPTIMEWVPLLMQLICSGAVDRQTDSSELFTNCLDMLCTLLQTLPMDFHICLASGGEEGSKKYMACIKKLKAELSGAKSAGLPEIQQLFPLTQKSYDVVTVKPPTFQHSKGKSTGEKIKGLRVHDTKVISPWELLEGVRNSGPLMLSWFGAVRMKRKPLKYEEQRKLIRFHTHQNHLQAPMHKMHYVSLPDLTPVPDELKDAEETEKTAVKGQEAIEEKPLSGPRQPIEAKPHIAVPETSAGQVPPPRGPMVGARPTVPGQMQVTGAAQFHPSQQHQRLMPPGFRPGYPTPRGMYSPQAQPGMHPSMALRLKEIQKLNANWQPQHSIGGHMSMGYANPQPHGHSQQVYSMGGIQQGGMMQRQAAAMAGYSNPQLQQARLRQQIMLQRMPPEAKLRYKQHLQLQQQQQAAMMQQQQMGQYNPQIQYRQLPQQQMRPLQANPPVPMQQVMQQSYTPGAPQQQVMVRPPQVQQQMQYAQQQQRMNPMHHPMF